mgnify:CR=1 FL=1
MAIKPNAGSFTIKEQIIEDPVSGLTFKFEYRPNSDAPYKLQIFGDLPHGNREFVFDAEGNEVGAGVALQTSCAATWIREVTT